LTIYKRPLTEEEEEEEEEKLNRVALKQTNCQATAFPLFECLLLKGPPLIK